MKKIKIFILCFFISIFTISSIDVKAETFYFGNNVIAELNEETKDLVVSGIGEIPSPTSEFPGIFPHRDIRKIIFNEGITIIGSGFLTDDASRDGIEEIIFPSSLKQIKTNAFCNYPNRIKKLDIPDGITLDSGSFKNYIIEKIYISNAEYLMDISEHCSIRNIVFKETTTIIPDRTKLTVDDNVYAVAFPSTIKHMPADYFEGSRVTKVYGYTGTIVEKVTKDAGIPFYSLGNVNSTVKEGTEFWDNNIKYRTVGSETAIVVAVARSKKTHRVPDTVEYKGIEFKVTGIGNNALKGNKNVTSFVGNRNIATIGKRAFEGCPKLNYVNLGTATAVKTIKYAAFRDCKSLAKITIPNKVSVIETSAFNGCKKLKEVKFAGNKVTTIGTYAFNGIASSVVFDVPNNKLYEYKKLFKGLKYPKGAKFI